MYSGRLAPEKALPNLLGAFALVVKQGYSRCSFGSCWRWLPSAGALVEQAKQLGLMKEDIRFTGRVDPQDSVPMVKDCDGFCARFSV